jgi:hypothetical protein
MYALGLSSFRGSRISWDVLSTAWVTAYAKFNGCCASTFSIRPIIAVQQSNEMYDFIMADFIVVNAGDTGNQPDES